MSADGEVGPEPVHAGPALVHAGRAEAGALGLRAGLRARSLPLASVLVVVVALSAPTAFYMVRVGQLRDQAATVAEAAALRLRHAAQQRPKLWRYDSGKLVQALSALRMDAGVGGLLVVDPGRRLVAQSAEHTAPAAPATLWQSRPVRVGGQTLATVWVAAPLAGARRMALWLLLPFLCIGLLLGGLLYSLPMGVIGRAEARIARLLGDLGRSQAKLESVNRGLEAQVGVRVAELQRAHAELKRTDARLRVLAARASGLQAAERRAIARDLHDGAGQVLTAIRLNLQVLQTGAPASPGVIPATLGLVDDAIDEIRRAVDSLGPSIVDDVGLVEAVRAHCGDVSERAGLHIECEAQAPAAGTPPAVENAAYRIVQEALHNVVKHAGASVAQVVLAPRDGALWLTVRDDGRGPGAALGGDDAGTADAGGQGQGQGQGQGIDSMRARAELLGGALSVEAVAGGGTRVTATLPLAPQVRDGAACAGGQG